MMKLLKNQSSKNQLPSQLRPLQQLQLKLLLQSLMLISHKLERLKKVNLLINLSSVHSQLVMSSKFKLLKLIDHQSRMTQLKEDMRPFFSPLLPNKKPFSLFTKICNTSNNSSTIVNHSNNSLKMVVSEVEKWPK